MSPRPVFSALAVAGVLACGPVGCDSSLRSATPGAVAAMPDPLVVTGVVPAEGSVELGPRFTLRITFAEPLDPSTLEGAVVVRNALTGAPVAGTERIEPGATPPQAVVVWQPGTGAMQPGERYTLALADALRSETGGAIDPDGTACETDECPRFPLAYETFQTIPELDGSVDVFVTSCSSAEVSWSARVADNSPAGEISYRVIVRAVGTPVDPEDFALETAPGVTEAFLEGLRPSTSYEVAVAAIDVVGNASSPTDAIAFTTPPEDRCDPIPPDFAGVTELSVDVTRPQEILVHWVAGTDNETARDDLRYALYVALESGGQDFSVPFAISAPGAERMAISGLPTGTTHYVVVRAADSSGNEDSNRIELAATTPVSFVLDVRPILDRSPPFGGACTRPFCHSAPTNSGGLNLETYEGLVIVGGATTNPRTVNPGNSARSYLLWRTDESNPNFVRDRSRMPLGSPVPLAADQLEALRRWIDQGAPDN